MVSSVEDLDLFHEQAVGVPLLMRIWVEFTTNDYIGAPQPDVHFEGLVNRSYSHAMLAHYEIKLNSQLVALGECKHPLRPVI